MPEGPDDYESFYDDPDRLDYPEADRLVAGYIDAHQTRPQATSVDVLTWAGYSNDHHNRQRVYDALCQQAQASETNWKGRTVFDLPSGDGNA